MSEAGLPQAAAPARKRLALFLPLAGFLALAILFLVRLGAGDPSVIPSALINKPVPAFSLPPIEAAKGGGLASADLAKGVHLLNVWASWCAPCRQEHPLLMRLAADKRIDLVGLNYKDVAENAGRFLGALGNPFARIGADQDGRTGIDFGVYGVPETFLIRDGIVISKLVGPLTEERIAAQLMPALERALRPG